MKILLKNGRVLDPSQGIDKKVDILIENGTINKLAESINDDKIKETIDCTNLLITPGLVDINTHLREPGHEDHESIESGTMAAAKGGYTSILPMPDTEPVIDDITHVKYISATAQRDALIKVHPVGAISKGLEGKQLTEMGNMIEGGAVAFSSDKKAIMNADLMHRAMQYSKMFKTTLILYANDENLAGHGQVNASLLATTMGLSGAPKEAEEIMVVRDVILARLTRAKVHFAHLSSPYSIQYILDGKKKFPDILSCDITPYHLTLSDEEIRGYNTMAKIMPPLRKAEHVKKMVQHFKDGHIDCISSNHEPGSDYSKSLEFSEASFGTIGLETAFPACYTYLVKTGKIPLDKIIRAMTSRPAEIIGIKAGSIKKGEPADISCFNLDKETLYDREVIVSKSKNSIYLNKKFFGFAEHTICEGIPVLKDGIIVKKST